MILSKWKGFTDFDIPEKPTMEYWRRGIQVKRASNGSWKEESLRYQLATITNSIADYIDSKKDQLNFSQVETAFTSPLILVDELIESLLEYPDNAIKTGILEENHGKIYVPQMYMVMNMLNILTNVYFDQEHYYILALMLIHEAIKTDSDELRLVAAIEAVQTIEFAKHRLTSKQTIKQVTKQVLKTATEQARKQSTKDATYKRAEKNDKIKEYAISQAKILHKDKSYLSVPQIADAIESGVIKEAGKIKYTIKSSDNFQRTIRDWIRPKIN